MGHARALVGKTPDNFDEKTLNHFFWQNFSKRFREKKKKGFKPRAKFNSGRKKFKRYNRF